MAKTEKKNLKWEGGSGFVKSGLDESNPSKEGFIRFINDYLYNINIVNIGSSEVNLRVKELH